MVRRFVAKKQYVEEEKKVHFQRIKLYSVYLHVKRGVRIAELEVTEPSS